jgi:regulator of replication initiation timing
MVERLPNLSRLSSDEKDKLIVRLFDELLQLRDTVQELQNRVGSLEVENQQLREENQELRGKLAKNSFIPQVRS